MSDDKLAVFIPMEVKARDLGPRMLLAAEFAEAGFHAVVGRKSTMTKMAEQLDGPIIWIDKGLDPRFRSFYERIKSNGGLLLQLHEEGGFIQPSILARLGQAAAFDPGIMPFCDLHLMWGEVTQKLLVEALPDYKNRFVVVGNPRFDLMKGRWSASRKKDALLISTSFVRGNPRRGDKYLRAKRVRISGDRFDADEWVQQVAYGRSMVEAMGRLAIRLAGEFPKLEIIVRPHPGENVSTYRRMFQQHARISASNTAPFRKQLARAAVMIHHDCTTAVEALFAGAPVVSYIPIKDRLYSQQAATAGGVLADSEDNAVAQIRRFVEDADAFQPDRIRAREALEPNIANFDFNCCQRIVNLVEGLLDRGDAGAKSAPLPKPNPLLAIRQKLIRIVTLDNDQIKKFPWLHKREVRKLLAEFGRRHDCRALGDGVHLIG